VPVDDGFGTPEHGLSLRTPAELLAHLSALRSAVAAEGKALYRSWRPAIERRPFGVSALNFAHYLVLRRRDLRDLQSALMPYGLSSLGRLEARVLANLDADINALRAICGERPVHYPRPWAFFRGERLLRAHTETLLGPEPRGRYTRVMATLPTVAAKDPHIAVELVRGGVDAVRINCGHDSPEVWSAMVANVRSAEVELGRHVRVVMDLEGPKCRIGTVRCAKGKERLGRGDHFLLRAAPGGKPKEPPVRATLTLPGVIERLKAGDSVFVDDGKLGGTVEKMKVDQGLNFPATGLGVAALTAEDRQALDMVAELADVIGYSFVQSGEDVRALQAELAERRPDDWGKIGLIAKIETPLAVHNLPEIIVEAASRQPFGVMIARGDLAVEIGFERLAEMQEEILWLCEAAHVPVIWATQVLESLIRKGLPSRGDMTDAAMSARSECVMLNKGSHVLEAIALLDRLLARMSEHQSKKTHRLRALRSW
jgi:pyruvate kinase